MTDQPPTDLRDRIAAALLARIKRATISKSQPHDAFTSLLAANEFDLADAVLAVLPPPADRAMLLAEAIRRVEDPAERAKTAMGLGLGWEAARDVLRRLAAEAQQPADRGAEEDIEVRVARHLDDWEMQSSRTRADRQTLAREVIAIVRAEPQPEFQDRGEAARRAAGIDGTAGDAQDIPHAFVLDEPTGGCLLCGLAPSYRKHGAEAQQQPDTETPCGPAPGQCDAESGEPCTNHEREAAHAEGEHCFCGPECEAACTCGVAGDALVPLGHYADCPQADEPSGAPRRARVDPDGPEKAAVCPSDGQTAPERPSRATDA